MESDEFVDVVAGRPVRKGESVPAVTVYWPEMRPTAVLQFNSMAVAILRRSMQTYYQTELPDAPWADFADQGPVEIALLISKSEPRRLAIEYRHNGLRISKSRVASAGKMASLVRQQDCPLKILLAVDPERPGRLLGMLPLSMATSEPVTTGTPSDGARASIDPEAGIAAPAADEPLASTDLHHVPMPELMPASAAEARSDVRATLELANTLPPLDLTPAPSPEDLMEPDGNQPDDGDGSDDDEDE